jgi:hypothetical protein
VEAHGFVHGCAVKRFVEIKWPAGVILFVASGTLAGWPRVRETVLLFETSEALLLLCERGV